MGTEMNAEGNAPPEESFRDGARDTGPALELHYRFVVWLIPALARFPRTQKFLLGDRIQGIALDVLESQPFPMTHEPEGGRVIPT